MKKNRIAIFFGGPSREREISFFGGRTVYDNIDKSLYEPVLVFVDEFKNFIKLKWQYIYKGSIKDFYSFSSEEESNSVHNTNNLEIGEKINPENFKTHFDFAFLVLHGNFGEDGSIQGLLSWYDIPYSGSKILGSAVGLNKIFHKKVLNNAGFDTIPSFNITRYEWLQKRKSIFENDFFSKHDKYIVKSNTQGSSIGVYEGDNSCFEKLSDSVDRSFFIKRIKKNFWMNLSIREKKEFCNSLSDLEQEIGFPLFVNKIEIKGPISLQVLLDSSFEKHDDEILLQGSLTEKNVIIEKFVEGVEFSCIVLQEENEKPVALPPTKMIKSGTIFSFEEKYLPGSINKKTPIDSPLEQIKKICNASVLAFENLNFSTYARIDGIISEDKIFINDPNTTVGMLHSSFMFQQASLVGINPKQLITFIIENS